MIVMKVVVASHHFVVKPLTDEAKKFVYHFLRGYIHENKQGKNVKITTFAASNVERSEFRFHINSYSAFKQMAYDRNFADKTETFIRPMYEPRKIKVAPNEGWAPRGDQPYIIKYLNDPVGVKDPLTNLYPKDTGARARFVGIQTGEGKALPMDQVFRTPTGTVLNKDLKVGDMILAWDGSPTHVVSIFPQGVKPCYEVKFGDGRTVRCCNEHLWGVYINGNQERTVINTDDAIKLLGEGSYLRIDAHYASEPGKREELEEIFKKSRRQEWEGGFQSLSFKEKEEALSTRELAWSCGYSCLYIDMETKHLLFITKDVGDFNSQTLPLVRIEKRPDEEMQCIEISHPDKQYIIGDWIVTHNTATSLFALADREELFAVVVEAQYVGKWVNDIAHTLNIKKNEILQVQGSDAIQGLTQMALAPSTLRNIKAIVIANRSLDNYFRTYESFGRKGLEELGYMVPPDELFERLNVGTRLIDEVHSQFHAQFRIDLYTHVCRSISLTATLANNDVTMERFYELAYPKNERCVEPPLKKYTDAFAVSYSFPAHWQTKTSVRGSSSYNHAAYEESIMKNPSMKLAYYNMINRYLKEGWQKNYQTGDKFMIFCATIEMCTDFTEWLTKQWPGFDIKRYVGEDAADKKKYVTHLQNPDGRVTTPGAGGTGHDIKGVTDVHNTVNLDSFQRNVQIFGRARFIEGKQTRFYWYNNINIPQHIKYDRRRIDIFKPRAKSIGRLSAGPLGKDVSKAYFH